MAGLTHHPHPPQSTKVPSAEPPNCTGAIREIRRCRLSLYEDVNHSASKNGSPLATPLLPTARSHGCSG
uniref:Uncharacterized protein n=1 Tax=Salix viminalis TaxID=40686 RepID=A0A6N2LEP1_SALVM